MGAFWGAFGAHWGPFGLHLGPFGRLWGPLGSLWGPFGGPLHGFSSLYTFLEVFSRVLDVCRCFETCFQRFRRVFRRFWTCFRGGVSRRGGCQMTIQALDVVCGVASRREDDERSEEGRVPDDGKRPSGGGRCVTSLLLGEKSLSERTK